MPGNQIERGQNTWETGSDGIPRLTKHGLNNYRRTLLEQSADIFYQDADQKFFVMPRLQTQQGEIQTGFLELGATRRTLETKELGIDNSEFYEQLRKAVLLCGPGALMFAKFIQPPLETQNAQQLINKALEFSRVTTTINPDHTRYLQDYFHLLTVHNYIHADSQTIFLLTVQNYIHADSQTIFPNLPNSSHKGIITVDDIILTLLLSDIDSPQNTKNQARQLAVTLLEIFEKGSPADLARHIANSAKDKNTLADEKRLFQLQKRNNTGRYPNDHLGYQQRLLDYINRKPNASINNPWQ